MPNEEVKVVGLSSKKSGGKGNFKIILAIVGIIVLAAGIVAGIILVREQQNISEDAQSCTEECPGADGVLRNCTPPNSDGTANESVCNVAGLQEFCGTRNFCCPSAGAAWSTNLSLCATNAPTTTATATATATSTSESYDLPTDTPTGTGLGTPTATPTGSGTRTATPTGSSMATPTSGASVTPFPVPETGVSWSTILGAGIGIIVILTSFILVL